MLLYLVIKYAMSTIWFPTLPETVTNGRESLGTGSDSFWTGYDIIGTGRDSLTTGRDSLKTDSDSIGTSRYSLTTGRDSLRTGRDSLRKKVLSIDKLAICSYFLDKNTCKMVKIFIDHGRHQWNCRPTTWSVR